MAAFDPATIQLLRDQLRDTNAQHKRDLNQRSKLHNNSKSKMAIRLDNRIGEATRVARDLERLLAFAEGVNRLYADHDAGLHDDGTQRLNCPACIGSDSGRPAAAEVLSSTPLAVAFGAAPAAEDGEQR